MNLIALTKEHEELLFQIPLFRDLPSNIKDSLLEQLDYSVHEISKGEQIAKQNTICRNLMVLLEGRLRVDIFDALGNQVMIENIVAPRAFATPHLFSADSLLPATFTVVEEGIYFTATKTSLFELISKEPSILKKFLQITGNCNRCTVSRLRALSHKSVRGRFVTYLLEHSRDESDKVTIEHNIMQLAEYLCVTRPALSKEINKMIKEGLIAMNGKQVRLVDLNRLKMTIL